MGIGVHDRRGCSTIPVAGNRGSLPHGPVFESAELSGVCSGLLR